MFFYIFAFPNVSYHTDFSDNAKIILYYKDIPLFRVTLIVLMRVERKLFHQNIGTMHIISVIQSNA